MFTIENKYTYYTLTLKMDSEVNKGADYLIYKPVFMNCTNQR